jgi:secreted Zn-dependent insulinase-like peptidase
MKTTQQQISECSLKKKSYSPPTIEKIRLDNEISMVMMSDPPIEGLPMQDPLIFF